MSGIFLAVIRVLRCPFFVALLSFFLVICGHCICYDSVVTRETSLRLLAISFGLVVFYMLGKKCISFILYYSISRTQPAEKALGLNEEKYAQTNFLVRSMLFAVVWNDFSGLAKVLMHYGIAKSSTVYTGLKI